MAEIHFDATGGCLNTTMTLRELQNSWMKASRFTDSLWEVEVLTGETRPVAGKRGGTKAEPQTETMLVNPAAVTFLKA